MPHVRDHVPERALTTWILLDVSASMAFGTGARLKSDVAAGVAEVVGRLAVRRAGRVALLTCGAPTTTLLPPRGGRRALVALRRAVAAGVAPDGAPPPGDALGAGLRRLGAARARPRARRGRVGLPRADAPWTRPLRALAAPPRRARASRSPTRARPSCPTPASSCSSTRRPGARMEVDSADAELRRAFAAAELGRRDALKSALRRARARHVELSAADEDWLRALGTGPAMSFQAPIFLLGLAVVPLALAALCARAPAAGALRRPLPGAADAGGVAAARARAGAGSSRRRCSASRSPGSRSRSRGPRRPSPCRSSSASVVLVTDTCGSMNATDVEPSRLAAAKAAAERFLDRVPDELRVGLVAYSDAPARRPPARPRTTTGSARRSSG